MRKYFVGLVQMDTQNNKGENLRAACAYIDEAAARGVKMVCFPEVMNLIGKNVGEGGGSEPIPGYSTKILMEKAREHHIYIHCGSITEKNPEGGRPYNTSVMVDPGGQIIARYRKLHTFDITLPDGTPYHESDKVHPGQDIVTVDTELGKLGLSICYDLRFPELYRLMAMDGAQVILVPASFTMPTGKDHWEPLLRARAIENGCYILAPGQIGQKPKYTAYGNSIIADPWGTVTARAKDEPGVLYGEIDMDYLERVRRQIPSLKNRRADVYDLR